MKTKFSISSKTFLLTVYLFVIFGICIGLITIWKEERIVRGLLGFAAIYLIQLLFFPSEIFTKKAITPRIELSEGVKYFVMGLLLSIIVSWSTYYVISTVMNLIMLLKY